MLRHERAPDAANKAAKEGRSFGVEEVHPASHAADQTPHRNPKNKQIARACLTRQHIGRCRRVCAFSPPAGTTRHRPRCPASPARTAPTRPGTSQPPLKVRFSFELLAPELAPNCLARDRTQR